MLMNQILKLAASLLLIIGFFAYTGFIGPSMVNANSTVALFSGVVGMLVYIVTALWLLNKMYPTFGQKTKPVDRSKEPTL